VPRCYSPGVDGDVNPPDRLPFLESLSWFDREWRALPPIDMLRRYESGWRHIGVTAEPTRQELGFIRALVEQYGSFLDVPA
jgi:hypothetical protein